jgi:hypothetical protein
MMALFNDAQRDGLVGMAVGMGTVIVVPLVLASMNVGRPLLVKALSKYLQTSPHLQNAVEEAQRKCASEREGEGKGKGDTGKQKATAW